MKLLVNADEVSDTYGGWNKSNGGESLYHDLRNAWACVTFSSNAATEAICEGVPKIKESYVDLDIKSDINDNVLQTKTYYKVLLYNKKTSLIKFLPKTGKKHQLRIVAKNLGCPIVGDQKYNLNQTKQRENLKLNAFKLEFDIENSVFNITSALPKDFTDYLKLKNFKFNPKII